ncbi:hypothetical protein BBP40_000459 [Aspergillus hancockii]|nr:hypothetical protein BBP40_000459 [Aspergillus hancockii]
MMALGARFSQNKIFARVERRRRGDNYAAYARCLLDLNDISVQTVQACILLGTVCFSESNTKSEALYYSIATRLACILDLPKRTCKHEIERQVNLRVWWSLYMIDIWSSMGLNLPRQLEFVETFPLPMNETTFLALSGLRSTADARSQGLWSEMAMLTRIWAEIHQLNKATVEGRIGSRELETGTDRLSHALQSWSDGLPQNLKENQDNLERYARLGLGNAYAALHLGFHFYHEVLYYQFLGDTGQAETESVQRYRSQCQKHAFAFCDLLYRCRALEQCQAQYAMVAHMLVVTSTIYIHVLLFSEEEEKIRMVRHRLVRNFEICSVLQTFWAPLDVALSRLQTFHSTCKQSIDRSFCMDGWLLKFIIEHGSSITERPLHSPVSNESKSAAATRSDSADIWRNEFLRAL